MRSRHAAAAVGDVPLKDAARLPNPVLILVGASVMMSLAIGMRQCLGLFLPPVTHELGLTAAETTMIGDTMETDILGGVQLGCHTVLVLSGGTRKEDLQRYAYRPEIMVDSVAEFAAILDKMDWRPPWYGSKEVRRAYEKRAVAVVQPVA